jgi:hypothetical protein
VNCIPPSPICSEPDGDLQSENCNDSPLATRRFSLDPRHVAYARATRLALAQSFGEDATAPEKLLLDLVSAEVPIHLSLVDAEAQLAARLEQLLLRDDIKSVATLARAMKQVSVVVHAIGRRVETVLSTAVALKAQRRLTELHRGGAE